MPKTNHPGWETIVKPPDHSALLREGIELAEELCRVAENSSDSLYCRDDAKRLEVWTLKVKEALR